MTLCFAEWKFGLAKLIRNMQRTNVAPSPLNLFTTWLVLIRKRFLERKHEKMRAQLKFRRAMRDDIMQKAPGMRFVVEQRNKKNKKKKKPRVIHALGNIKWGFTPAGKLIIEYTKNIYTCTNCVGVLTKNYK